MNKIENLKSAEERPAFGCRSLKSLLAGLAIVVAASPFVSEAQAQKEVFNGLDFSGDFRLRYENTNNQQSADIRDSRSREVVRFRAGLSRKINGLFKFGARLATGSSDDPNTADVTLGNFVNDLEISLDRVFLELRYQNLFLTGGKFANPFLRTDLVWDGDVNPQGLAGSYTFSGSPQFTSKISGMYGIVDEHSSSQTPDSEMWGGQIRFDAHPTSDWSLTLAGGYYDYNITSLSNADAGDTRSNFLDTAGTGYMSDFDLFDAIASIEYRGFSKQYPVRFVGDFVKNLDAANDKDSGFMFDVFVGKASKKKDLRFRYGYSETKTDAVLAAFSNDNTTIATNYKQHTVTIDYVAVENTTLNLTWYLHRKNQLLSTGDSSDYVSRVRLNAVVKF
jgi:hypothetical protein